MHLSVSLTLTQPTLTAFLPELVEGLDDLFGNIRAWLRKMSEVGPEALPPGATDPAIETQVTRKSTEAEEERQLIPERLRFLEKLGPISRPMLRSRRWDTEPYYVFVYEKFVVVEHQRWGSAAYVFQNIEGVVNTDGNDLVSTDKMVLRKTRPAGYVGRVLHQGDWQDRLTKLITS